MSANGSPFQLPWMFPKHVTKQHYDRHVNLLLIADTCKALTYHYYVYCLWCQERPVVHQREDFEILYVLLSDPVAQTVDMPSEDDKWLFHKYIQKQLKVPYIMYADIECLQVNIEVRQEDPSTSYTEKTTRHVPCGFAYKVVGLNSAHGKEPVVYRGSAAVDQFVSAMLEEQEWIEEQYKHCESMTRTVRDWQTYKKAKHCPYTRNSWGRNVSEISVTCHDSLV